MAEQPFLAPAGLVAVGVTGEDRSSYLEAVLSQQLSDAEPGIVRGALELDVHGAPLAAMDIVVLPDRLVLLVPDPIADEVVARLGGRTFLSDARFTRLADEVLALRGDDAQAPAEGAGLACDPGHAREADGIVVVGREGGLDLVGPAEVLAKATAQLRELGAEDADAQRLEAWRIHAGVPGWGREITAPHLPEELGLLPTHVHLAKGCYPGQEAVARMWTLGRPRRRLALIAVDDGVDVDWQVGAGTKKARVTSVAELDGQRRGLAFVPGATEPGARFEDDDGTGLEVLRLVGADAPVPGHDPAVPRRRDHR